MEGSDEAEAGVNSDPVTRVRVDTGSGGESKGAQQFMGAGERRGQLSGFLPQSACRPAWRPV